MPHLCSEDGMKNYDTTPTPSIFAPKHAENLLDFGLLSWHLSGAANQQGCKIQSIGACHSVGNIFKNKTEPSRSANSTNPFYHGLTLPISPPGT